MDDWFGFLATVALSSLGTTTALLALGYLLRAQISHLLLRDIEAIKARHQQDLEAYKVGLIAEAEHAKSKQAIKTAKALRIAELEFAALDRVQKAVMPHASRASAFMRATASAESFRAAFSNLNAALAEATDAIRSAGMFLPQEDIDSLFALQHAYAAAVGAAWKNGGSLSELESEALELPLFEAQRTANELLRRHVMNMLEMS